MSRSDIEGVALENAVIRRNLVRLRVGKYHFEFVRECTPESDLPSIQPHMFIDNGFGDAANWATCTKNVGWTTLLVSKSKKTYPTVRRYGTRPQKVSHRYGSDKYHNPAQGGSCLPD